MKKFKIVFICIILAVLQAVFLIGCGRGGGLSDSTQVDEITTAEDKAPGDDKIASDDKTKDDDNAPVASTVTVGSIKFQNSYIAQLVNNTYSHAVYYRTGIFYKLSDNLNQYLEEGGIISYKLYATSKKLSRLADNRVLLVEIDGDNLPIKSGANGKFVFHSLVLTEEGVQSSPNSGIVADKDSGNNFRKEEASAMFLGEYELTYDGKPSADCYVTISDELMAAIKSALTNSFATDGRDYEMMPSGKYTAYIAPAFRSDDTAYVYFRYENGGGSYSAYWFGYTDATPDNVAALRGLSFLHTANSPDYLDIIETQIADSPCAVEFSKEN